MDKNSPSSRETSAGAPGRVPLTMLVVMCVLFTVRWIWITGIGDFSTTDELGRRIWSGEMPYRDFISTMPQLTGYTVVPFLALFRGNLWADHVHVYLWWIASMLAGLGVLRRLNADVRTQTAAVFLAACLSFPANNQGNPYNYAGAFFFGLALLELLRFQQTLRSSRAWLAGIWIGWAILAKQNMGLGAMLVGVATLGLIHYRTKNLRSALQSFTGLFAGCAVILLPALAYLAGHANWHEVITQMFLDAGKGKGGAQMLKRMMPLIWFTPETPHRHLWTLIISSSVIAGFAVWFWRENRASKNNPPPQAVLESPWPNIFFPLASVAAVILISAVSLFDLPGVRHGIDQLQTHYLYRQQSYFGVFVYLLYAGSVVLGVFCAWRALVQRREQILVAALAMLMIVAGMAMSDPSYLKLAAPVAMPLAVYLFGDTFRRRRSDRLAYSLGTIAVWSCLIFSATSLNAPVFEPVYRLPDQGAFAHLYARQNIFLHTTEKLNNISPRIEGHKTLWLCGLGPHLAFGGKPIYSVAFLFIDSYNFRWEKTLINQWDSDPPDFVVFGPFVPCKNSEYFTQEYLSRWLPQHYHQVWVDSAGETSLWESKTRPGSK